MLELENIMQNHATFSNSQNIQTTTFFSLKIYIFMQSIKPAHNAQATAFLSISSSRVNHIKSLARELKKRE